MVQVLVLFRGTRRQAIQTRGSRDRWSSSGEPVIQLRGAGNPNPGLGRGMRLVGLEPRWFLVFVVLMGLQLDPFPQFLPLDRPWLRGNQRLVVRFLSFRVTNLREDDDDDAYIFITPPEGSAAPPIIGPPGYRTEHQP